MKTESPLLALAFIGKAWKGVHSAERFRLVVESTNEHPATPDLGAFVAWAWLLKYPLSLIDNACDYIKAISTFEPFIALDKAA